MAPPPVVDAFSYGPLMKVPMKNQEIQWVVFGGGFRGEHYPCICSAASIDGFRLRAYL
jgi:hypothetical protein